MIKNVLISRKAQKQLEKIPRYLWSKLKIWLEDVETKGLVEVIKIPGFHNEQLKGNRTGQCSIRLNKSYRVFYIIREFDKKQYIEIIEVNKHDY